LYLFTFPSVTFCRQRSFARATERKQMQITRDSR